RANAKTEITRFKGLGEMPPKTLKDTTLDPRQRTLLRVNIDSNLEADNVFVELLGKDPSSRYRFLMDSAALAEAEELNIYKRNPKHEIRNPKQIPNPNPE